MIRSLLRLCVFLMVPGALAFAQTGNSVVNLPSSKQLTVPTPGHVGSTNSFPVTMVLSPDGRYAALLNDGHGTQETLGHQSIAVLNLATNQIADFPDSRLPEDAHQSYFIGLAFSSDGKHLYASVGSLTDPTGARAANTGNGIAVYSFAQGKVAPEKFIPIPPQALPTGKTLAVGLTAPPHSAIPYPAGMALISDGGHDKLLIANNLSDNVVLLDVASGKILQTFDLSTNELVPSSFPYTVVATRDGRRAWCSLWNASQVAELDLTSGRVTGWSKLKQPQDPLTPGSHPTAMLLSPDEKTLYVALSNLDQVAEVSTSDGTVTALLSTASPAQK
ncbi:MAG: phosphoesterase, partial [Acidobacteriota bacterium]